MGSSGSGGGSGSSGTVDYPSYMKAYHSVLYSDIRGAASAAIGNNPYNYIYPWNPSTMITRMSAAVQCYDDVVEGFDPFTMWQALLGAVPALVRQQFIPENYQQFFTGVTSNRPNKGDMDANAPVPNMEKYFSAERFKTYPEHADTSFFFDSSNLDPFIDAQKERICENTHDKVIPQFRRGMQNIGAVMTSSFKIGEALLWKKSIEEMATLEKEYKMKMAEKEKDVRGQMLLQENEGLIKLALARSDAESKAALQLHEGQMKLVLSDAEYSDGVARTEAEYRGKLALLSYEYSFKPVSEILSYVLQKIGWIKEIMHYMMETERMGYTAMKEYTDAQNAFTVERVKWPLEMYKYPMDALGSIASSAGTSYSASSGGVSRAASGVSGALAGASTGAMVGSAIPGIGTGIGAAVGGAAGLIGGLL